MKDERPAPAAIRQRLTALTCPCGAPATRIEIVDPAAADRPPERFDDRNTCDGFPTGSRSVARPVCDTHTFSGYGFEIRLPVCDWDGWLEHISSKGMGADDALRRLIAPTPEAAPPRRRGVRRARRRTRPAPWWS